MSFVNEGFFVATAFALGFFVVDFVLRFISLALIASVLVFSNLSSSSDFLGL